ncbi:hypothetical protein H4W00_000992 [Psychrobacter sp. PL19]|uniref:hypothetical protein n=1 Tax=Psychrobacter sp. PL19 TaxID=2760711 RepID=UPI001AE2CB7D
MGLVNHLSLEKNCKVVVILHEGEAGENFREYKEKVFDEVLVLDDSLSIIKDKISDIETFPIYEKFYQTMGVRNLRFYQRVQKIYHEIIKHSSSLSKLSKEEILRQILIIKLVNDIPKVLDIDMKELETYFSEDGLDDRLDIFLKSDDEALKATVRTKKDAVEEKLSKFYPNFRMEGWTDVVIELITDINIDDDRVEQLFKQDSINEAEFENDREKQKLMTEYNSLNISLNFNQRLFDNISRRINRETLENLGFHYNTLSRNGAQDLADKLQELIRQHIKEKVSESSDFWDVGWWYRFGRQPNDTFKDYIEHAVKERKVEINTNLDIATISRVFIKFYQHGNENLEFCEAIQNIDKVNLKTIIWQSIEDEQDRKLYIHKILQHPAFGIKTVRFNDATKINNVTWSFLENTNVYCISIFSYHPFIVKSKRDEVRQWTLELLQERIIENSNTRASVESWLEHTDNLNTI